MKVLLTHPARQHSHQLVQALHEAGMLFEYWTGVPAHERPSPPVLGPLLARLSKYDSVPIPEEQVRHCFALPIVNRLARWLLPAPQAVVWSHRAQAWFDHWCARRLSDASPDAVVCYENAARKTFRRARTRGITTILDAASFHHVWQDRFYDYVESDEAHARITRRKDEEITLADHILTVSEFARESYLDAGIPPERVTAVPMGCDLERFSPEPRPDTTEKPFTFIFAGKAGRRKGIDLLLKASAAIHEEQPHRLVVAGDTSAAIDWDAYPWVERKGRVPQETLAELYRQADCFVLPSRHDSFGMVVVEAMASGLPVLVSDHVGAKEAVEEGESGWVVPAEDTDALAERMRWCIAHADRLPEMGENAAKAAQRYDWSRYHRQVVRVIDEILTVSSASIPQG